VVRVFVTYEQEPDPERYEQHAELCRKVPGATFRHGKITRTLFGTELAYYAEWEWPDEESFKAVARGEEMAATGKDAAEMGIPHSVYVVGLD
jgi:hypothetical protein